MKSNFTHANRFEFFPQNEIETQSADKESPTRHINKRVTSTELASVHCETKT